MPEHYFENVFKCVNVNTISLNSQVCNHARAFKRGLIKNNEIISIVSLFFGTPCMTSLFEGVDLRLTLSILRSKRINNPSLILL